MTPEDALKAADEALIASTGKSLTDIQRLILQGSLANKGYEKIQGYEAQHIKNEGSKLWKLLSEALGEKVSKTSFRGALEKRLSRARFVRPVLYNSQTWVERSELTEPLLQVLRGTYRVIAFTGITGIGKTEFAGRLISELDDGKRFCRLNLDEGSISPDFASSGAALLRELGEEPTLEDQKDAKNLLTHLLKLLRTQSYRVQIDSMEKLLEGNDQDGWSEFCDPLWLDLLQQVLAGNQSQSQLILTTQDVPGELAAVGSRYEQVWHCEPIRGLSEAEQLQLFQKHGIAAAFNATVEAQHPSVTARNAIAEDQYLNVTAHNTNVEGQRGIAEAHNAIAGVHNANVGAHNANVGAHNTNVEGQHRIAGAHSAAEADSAASLLKRIGKLYEGHPLVLRVIAEDLKTCGNDVKRYWQQNKFAELESNRPAELSRPKLQLEVKRRVRAALSRLPKDALDLLCRSAVYRRPVPEAFWLAMLPDCSEPQAVLNLLKSRALAEENWQPGVWLGADGAIPLRQHNLIRAVAYELLKADTTILETAERQAAEMWLNRYEPVPDAPNLEKVRGQIEAFHHFCELEDWEKASEMYTLQLSLMNQQLCWQLFVWGYYQELIQISSQLFNKASDLTKLGCLLNLGISYSCLGDLNKATEYHQRALTIARRIGDRQGESNAFGNLGMIYSTVGKYEDAIAFHEKHRVIACEIGDRQGEGNALCNLGVVSYLMGKYEQAIDYYSQHITIACEIGDRQGESNALCNLGLTYHHIGNYQEALKYYHLSLEVASAIGNRLGEGKVLCNLGFTYNKLADYHQALNYHQQSLSIARRIGDRQGEGITLCNLCETQIKLEQYADAEKSSQDALRILQAIGDRASEAETYRNIAELHQKTGSIDLAQQYCEQALVIATELGIPLAEECEELKKQLEE